MASSVVSQAAAPSMMLRVDRLDLVVGYLEEMRCGSVDSGRRQATSSPSTTTTTVSDCGSSAASTPRGMSCRPVKEALQEARVKGSLVDRIAFLENRVLKMEDEMEVTSDLRSSRAAAGGGGVEKQQQRGKAEKGKRLKSMVKSCLRSKLKSKD
ncbi:hypothetical protein ABZP36_004915 [Zizania latifolia]